MPPYGLALGMGVACNPLIQSGSYPEAVDAAGNDHQQKPLDPVAEQLGAVAFEAETLAVDHEVTDDKFHHIADRPRSSDAAGEGNDQAGDERI